MSGGFALTYTITTPTRKCAVRCFHRDIPAIEQRYNLISTRLKTLRSDYFINFEFQKTGIKVQQQAYPIVKMEWVEGDPLGVWLDKNVAKSSELRNARSQFQAIASFLEKEGIAHGDIQNGNIMMAPSGPKLIDYDGMFVPGMKPGDGTETGHKHFQHRDRTVANFGPKMDRFSFIVLDLSLAAISEDKALHSKFRNGGETIIFTANDFAEPKSSAIFNTLLNKPTLRDQAKNFIAVCDADISAVPTLEDFLQNKNIPRGKARLVVRSPIAAHYIGPFPVVDALDFKGAERHVGDKIELIGKIVEVKHDVGRRGRGKDKPYVFINFGPWRERIVKISIWSEGLLKLKEQPSKDWVGRWVSVTGLLDPPYRNPRFGYTHLSVTVQEDGQIQTLDEKQARFRLGGGTPAPITIAGKSTTTATPSTSKTAKTTSGATGTKIGSGNAATKNQDIVKKFTAKQPQTPTHVPYSPPPATPTPAQSSTQIPTFAAKPVIQQTFLNKVPNWAWVVLVVLVILLLFMLSRPPAQKRAGDASEVVATSSSRVPTESSSSPRNVAPGARPDPATDNLALQPPQTPDGSRKVRPDNLPSNNGENDNLPQSLPSPTTAPPIVEGGAATEPMPNTDKALLHIDRPADASMVQRKLVDLGFDPGVVNGDWGAQSQQALVDFQIVNGISRDRAFDMGVQSRLFSRLAARVIDTTSTTYTGEWSRALSQCTNDGRTIITPKRAQAAGAVCDFMSVERELSAWRIKAKCTNNLKAHFATVRLLRSGIRLFWSSESGVTTYVRCPRPSSSIKAPGAE
jgi:hypothetical protein